MSSNDNGSIGMESSTPEDTNPSASDERTTNNSSNSQHTNMHNTNNIIQPQNNSNHALIQMQQLSAGQENINNSLLSQFFNSKYDQDSFVDDNVDNVNYLNALYANSSNGNGEDPDFPLFFWDMDDGAGPGAASGTVASSSGGRSTPAAIPQTAAAQGSASDSSQRALSTNNQAMQSQPQPQSQLQGGNTLNTNYNSSANMSQLNPNNNMNLPQSQSATATAAASNFSTQNFVNELTSQLASSAGGAGGGTTGTNNASSGNEFANAPSASSANNMYLPHLNFGNFQFDNLNNPQQQLLLPASGALLGSAQALQQGDVYQSSTNPISNTHLFNVQGNAASPWNNPSRSNASTSNAASTSNNNTNPNSHMPQHQHFVNPISILPKVNGASVSNSSGSTSNNSNNLQQQQQQQNNINQLLGSLNPQQLMNSLGFSQNSGHNNINGGTSNNSNSQQQQDNLQQLQMIQHQLYNQGNLMFPSVTPHQQQRFQMQMTSQSSNASQQQYNNNQSRYLPSITNSQKENATTNTTTSGKQESDQQKQQKQERNRGPTKNNNNNNEINSSSKKRKLGNDQLLSSSTSSSATTPNTTATTLESKKTNTHAVVSSSDTDCEHVPNSQYSAARSSNTSSKQRNTSASSASGSGNNVSNSSNNKISTKESSISSISSNSRRTDPNDVKLEDNQNEDSATSLSKADEDLTEEEKAQANRLRNREHARNTRARKKAYLESLKLTLDELCKERDTLVSERAGAASLLLEMQKTRTDVLLSFFALRSSYEKRRQIWSSILDESVMCVIPVTPYRSFPASEVQISRCQRNVMGIDGMISDTASLHVLLNSLVDRSKHPNAVTKFRYTLVSEDSVVSGNQMMARWSMTTENAVQLGAKREVSKSGMLCAKFNSAHKIVHLELMFDVMAFMLQLKQSSGATTFTMVPNTVQTCIGQFSNQPMVITLAERPYTITHVNPAWEEMTSWTSEEVVGKHSCKILQGDETEEKTVEALICHVQFQRPSTAAFLNYDRYGRKFRHFMNVYPLSTDSKITHYFGLTVHYEKIDSCASDRLQFESTQSKSIESANNDSDN